MRPTNRSRTARSAHPTQFRPTPERLERRDLMVTGAVNVFPVPTPDVYFGGITTGPDGAMWFTEIAPAKIGRLDRATGQITEVPLPTANGDPGGITTGPDGALWFTETHAGQIGRIDPTTLTVTEYPIPTAGSNPTEITLGPDGNLWFIERTGNQVGQITPAGVVTEFAVPTANAILGGIAAGPDGNLWFTENTANQVAQVTPAGGVTEYPLTTPNAGPTGITTGPDGNLWLTETTADAIAKVTPAGVVTEYRNATPDPGSGRGPRSIVAGADGVLHFLNIPTNSASGYYSENYIGGITTGGQLTPRVPVALGNSPTQAIAAGPDGNLYYTQNNFAVPGYNIAVTPPTTQYIGRLNLASLITITAPVSVEYYVDRPITYVVHFNVADKSLTAADLATSIDFADNTQPVPGVIAGDAVNGFTLTATHTYASSLIPNGSYYYYYRNIAVAVRGPSGLLSLAFTSLRLDPAPVVIQASTEVDPATAAVVLPTVDALPSADAATPRKPRHHPKAKHAATHHAATKAHAVAVTHAAAHPKAKPGHQAQKSRS